MRKSSDLMGSPIISIADGAQVGEVKGLVVDPEEKRVEFFLLSEEGENNLQAVPFSRAEGVGDFAITVGQKEDILDLNALSMARHVLEKNYKIISAKVITKKGHLLGTVKEYAVNPETGEIVSYFYSREGEESDITIDAESVISIGKEMIIVQEGPPGVPVKEAEEKPNTADYKVSKPESSPQNAGSFNASSAAAPENKPETGQDNLPQFSQEKESQVNESQGNEDPSATFIQRQRDFIIGKSLLKELKSDNGEVIAWENDVVTEELFNKVASLGTQKLMELAMSVRE